jgi:hypothetical protein
LPPASNARPLVEDLRDHPLVLLQLRLGGDRAHLRGCLQRIAEPDVVGTLDQAAYEAVVDAALHESAGACDAGLPGRGEDSRQHAGLRLRQIGVVEHDVRALAA